MNGHESVCHIVLRYVLSTQFFVEIVENIFSGDRELERDVFFCGENLFFLVIGTNPGNRTASLLFLFLLCSTSTIVCFIMALSDAHLQWLLFFALGKLYKTESNGSFYVPLNKYPIRIHPRIHPRLSLIHLTYRLTVYYRTSYVRWGGN